MGILNIQTVSTGLVGTVPKIVYIQTNDTVATVTTAGYLNNAVAEGFYFAPSASASAGFLGSNSAADIALVQTTTGCAWFEITVSGGNTSLTEFAGPGGVQLPVVANHLATFVGTSGMIGDQAVTAINKGSIQAGLSGTAGNLYSFSATPNTGFLEVSATANGGNFATIITNAAMGQSSAISIPDPANALGRFVIGAGATPFVSGNFPVNSGTAGLMVDSGLAANKILASSFASPDTQANIVRFDITVGQAALAAGGAVTLQASSGSKQYKIQNLWINSGGTNFSGGGGDRLGQITDGTTVYSVIPAATMQALVNGAWGATAIPFPAAAAINTSTAAGAALVFKYSGGTVDYTAGSVVISGTLVRVA